MSYNQRVTDQATLLGLAYGTDRYTEQKETYFKVLEEELTKQPYNGWLDYENPVDTLGESVLDGKDPKWVEEILEDYKKFCEIVDRVRKTPGATADEKVIRMAEEYIELKGA